MGVPIKKTVGLNYANSDTYSAYPESAVVTFYTDFDKKKTTAKLVDENLLNLIKKVIDSDLITEKKLNGFLNSFNLGENTSLQSSTTCVINDVFDEVEGRKRAMAKVLVRRDICVNTLLDLIEEAVHKKFSNVKKRFILKLDCMDQYMDYYDAYEKRKNVKQSRISANNEELLNILKDKLAFMDRGIKRLESKFLIRFLLKFIVK